MHDAIELEKRGIPTALICTEEFIVPATTMARVCGIPDYPFIVIPHPLSSLNASQVQARAASVADQIAALLLQGTR